MMAGAPVQSDGALDSTFRECRFHDGVHCGCSRRTEYTSGVVWIWV